MSDKNNKLDVLRHSISHIMAAAVLELFPKAKFGIGPIIEEGFYYDFDLPRALTPDDLPAIEKKMRGLIEQNLTFKREELTVAKATTLFKKLKQNYKVELIKDLKKEKKDKRQETRKKTNKKLEIGRAHV